MWRRCLIGLGPLGSSSSKQRSEAKVSFLRSFRVSAPRPGNLRCPIRLAFGISITARRRRWQGRRGCLSALPSHVFAPAGPRMRLPHAQHLSPGHRCVGVGMGELLALDGFRSPLWERTTKAARRACRPTAHGPDLVQVAAGRTTSDAGAVALRCISRPVGGPLLSLIR